MEPGWSKLSGVKSNDVQTRKTHLTDGGEQLTFFDVGGALIKPRQKPSRRTVFRVWRILTGKGYR